VRVVFAGTPAFAARSLAAIIAAGHDVPLVLTQPDRPAGRGMRVAQSAVAQLAAERGIPLWKPATLRTAEAPARLREERADVAVVAAYGLILPAAILEVPARGCLNIHASLLPRWRGAAPVQRAIMAGDDATGISIMCMNAGLDTGPVLLTRTRRIEPRETAGSLTESLADIGAEAIVAALADLDRLTAQPQDDSRATYAAKITKAEARIDWREGNDAIDRRIRALDPAPGAEAICAGESLKIWKAAPTRASGAPGEVLEASGSTLVVACGSGALAIAEIQRPGGRRLPVADFLRGARLRPGMLFESAGVGPETTHSAKPLL
jgi:methionyl-tRNA formyltransferase